MDIELNKFTEKELREQLELEPKDIEIVLEYQELFPSLLVSCERGSFAVDSEKLWNELGQPYGGRYRDWFRQKIRKHYAEDYDYTEVFLKGDEKFYLGKTSREICDTTTLREKTRDLDSDLSRLGYAKSDSNEKSLLGAGFTKNRIFTLESAKAIAMRQMDELGDLVVRYFIIMEDTVKSKIDWIKERNPQKASYNAMCEVLEEQRAAEGKDTKNFVYSNNANMINRALFGRTSKEIQELVNNESIRDSFHLEINQAIHDVQNLNINYIMIDNNTYQERKAKTEKYVAIKYSDMEDKLEAKLI